MPRRSRPRPATHYADRYVAIMAILAAAAAGVILMACPPSSKQEKAPGPDTTHMQPAPEPSSQPSQGSGIPDIRAQQERGIASRLPEHPQPEEQGMLTVIIDDAGYNLEELQAVLDLPMPLTIAVLPNLPHSAEAARRVRAAGKTLILHCPMEPTGGENPGPGALYTSQGPDEVRSLLDDMFASVPGAVGMNNHMGSKATSDPVLMETVLGYLKERHLIYIDSRTTAETVGPEIARRMGVRFAQRDVFIDAATEAEEIASAFASGMARARTHGSAVLIGHVQNHGVVDILRSMNGRLEGQGARFAGLDAVLRAREGTDGR